MKTITSALCFIAVQYAAVACPVCERNKASALQGLTHGAGPGSKWDYVIVVAAIIIAIFTLFYSVKWLIHPNENNQGHIKLSILNEQ